MLKSSILVERVVSAMLVGRVVSTMVQVRYLEKCLDDSLIFVVRVVSVMLQTYRVGEGWIDTLIG